MPSLGDPTCICGHDQVSSWRSLSRQLEGREGCLCLAHWNVYGRGRVIFPFRLARVGLRTFLPAVVDITA